MTGFLWIGQGKREAIAIPEMSTVTVRKACLQCRLVIRIIDVQFRIWSCGCLIRITNFSTQQKLKLCCFLELSVHELLRNQLPDVIIFPLAYFKRISQYSRAYKKWKKHVRKTEVQVCSSCLGVSLGHKTGIGLVLCKWNSLVTFQSWDIVFSTAA